MMKRTPHRLLIDADACWEGLREYFTASEAVLTARYRMLMMCEGCVNTSDGWAHHPQAARNVTLLLGKELTEALETAAVMLPESVFYDNLKVIPG
jgi:hypothetical protein